MVRTRFAPSPTGTPESIHLGFVIRALWDYAYARKNQGKFILRIEDTDQNRSRKDTELAIYDVLRKFNIDWDEGPDKGGPYGPYRQSERLDKYQAAAKLLVEKGYAYYDFDAEKREKEEIKAAYESEEELAALKIRPSARNNSLEESLKRIASGDPYVVRVKIPEDRTFKYHDWILKKEIKFEGKEVNDLIILKSDGFPTYHLAVVVDDVEMKISHVFRGQEWISSTPIHLYLYEGLGYKIPEIGHFTVILDPRTGKKFSKRDMTALFGVNTWLNQGYLPEAVLNYLMLLGWAPKDNREFFSLDEFVDEFDQDGIQKANPTFNPTKLDWFNGQYLRQKSIEELLQLLKPFTSHATPETINLVKDRLIKLSDFDSLTLFLRESPTVDPSLFLPASREHLEFALKNLGNLNSDSVKAAGFKVGDFFMSLRIAICGSKFTPPINDVINILGPEETKNRIQNSINLITQSPN